MRLEVGREKESSLKRKLEDGKFVVTCEISPPRGPDVSDFIRKLEAVKPFADAVNITDNPMLSARMSPAGAGAIAVGVGVEPIMQITCRDRNSLGLTSEFISAWAFGVRNVLVLWGDPPRDNFPKAVWEVDVSGLFRLLQNLAQGLDPAGRELNSKMEFFKGAAINPYDDIERVLPNVEGKMKAGAEFFQTQPVFSERELEKLRLVREKLGIRNIIVGVIIAVSERMLDNIKKFAKGLEIPERIRQKIAEAQDKVSAGIDVALEISELVRSWGFAGVHIYSPAKESAIPVFLEKFRTR